MAKYTAAQRAAFFKAIGLSHISQRSATLIFQRAYNLGAALEQDGVFGELTSRAATRSKAYGYKISSNFHWSEFKCGDSCRLWKVDYRLLRGLEAVRKKYYPDGLAIVSGYRCKRHNAAVGGIPNSLHLTGLAADIPGKINYKKFSFDAIPYINGAGFKIYRGDIVHVEFNPERKHDIIFAEGK